MNKKLLIINRSIKGNNDGPEIILDSIFQIVDYHEYDICTGYKIYQTNEHIHNKLKLPFVNIHKELFFLFKNYKRIRSYKKILIFTYYSSPVLLMFLKILKLLNTQISIVGYDSFYRENIIKMKKHTNKIKMLPYFIKSMLLKFIEYLASIACDNIYLVSEKCIKFSRERINHRAPYKHFPIIPVINKKLVNDNKNFDKKRILIIGPFRTEIDIIDLLKNLELISTLDFIERIDFFGENSEKAKSFSKYPGSIYTYVDDFDAFFSKNESIVLYNRVNTPGIQTKLQKILMYNNLVYCHKDIDVGVYLNHLLTDINKISDVSQNKKQVKLEDIENALNNTLSDFKTISKDF